MSARELLRDMNAYLLEPHDSYLSWEEVAKRIEGGISYGRLTLWHVAAIGLTYGCSDSDSTPDRESDPCEAVVVYCQAIQKESEKFDV